MSSNYTELLAKSFRDLKNNPFLFILLITLSFGTAFFIAIIAGLQVALGLVIFKGALFSLASLPYWLAFGVIDTALLFLVIAFTNAAKYGIFLDVATGKKPTLRSMLRHGHEHMKNMLTLTLALLGVALIAYIPLVLLFLIAIAAATASPIAGILLGIALSLLYIAAIIFLSILLVFTFPIALTQKIGGIAAIKKSIAYSRANLKHSAMTVLVSFLVGIAGAILSTIARIPSVIAQVIGETAGGMSAGMWAVYAISYSLSMIISIVLSIILTLFVFNSYLSRHPKKKR